MYSHTSKAKQVINSMNQRAACASLVLETAEGKVLIVKAHYKPYWTFPGGFIDENESPLDAAIRETKEEVGIEVVRDEVDFLFVVDRYSYIAQTYHFVFRAIVPAARLEDIHLQQNELADATLVSREELIANPGYAGDMLEYWTQQRTGYIEQRSA